jgi:hypothetical protein
MVTCRHTSEYLMCHQMVLYILLQAIRNHTPGNLMDYRFQYIEKQIISLIVSSIGTICLSARLYGVIFQET